MIFIEDGDVLCRWPCSQRYDLESGGKTAALHITCHFAGLGLCARFLCLWVSGLGCC